MLFEDTECVPRVTDLCDSSAAATRLGNGSSEPGDDGSSRCTTNGAAGHGESQDLPARWQHGSRGSKTCENDQAVVRGQTQHGSGKCHKYHREAIIEFHFSTLLL